MRLVQRSSFASFIMILMILAGTLIGSHNSLSAMRNAASAIFSMGAQGDGIGIQGDLRERGNAAYNMVVIARKYLPEENQLIQNILASKNALDTASSVREKATANRDLTTAVRDLYDVLNGMDLRSPDTGYPQSLYTDFRSRGDTISHDPYNQAAAGFNQVLSGFPAGMLGGLTGIQRLELFE